MNHLSVLRKEMCFGRLVWIQPPSVGSAAFFGRKLLNCVGVADGSMIYLTARQFVRYSNNGFSPEFLSATRVLLIGDFENLCEKTKRALLSKLSHHQMFKHRYNLNLVIVSPSLKDVETILLKKLKPICFSLFGENHPIEINEKIHEYIENASIEFSKPIWQLSEAAAEYLELSYLNQGEDYLKRLIERAVQCVQGKKLEKKDLSLAQQCLNPFAPWEDVV